ncbi:hypothetical protein HD806DRAFT_495020 [Xylariaceae sp. AK1471]|nr:hypothetical protein HD806DRAFT_495020 [Xylariaceae sp. AK1471]
MSGTSEGIAQTSSITLSGFLAAEITLVTAASIFVALRLTANLSIQKRLLVDDYLSILAIFFLAAAAGLYYPTIAWLNDPNVSPLALARVSVATYFIAAYSNFTAKAPLLVLYTHLFGAKVWVRRTAFTTLGVGFLGYTATSIAGTLSNPKSADPKEFATFLQRSYGVAVANAVFNLAIDLIAFTIPIPVLYGLHLPLKKKIGLACIFASGIVAIAAGSVSLQYRRSSSAKSIEDLTIVVIFTLLDSTIGIMVGCVPALRSLWVKQTGQSGLLTKLRDLLSYNKTSTSTKGTRSTAKLDSDNSHYVTHSHNYIELQEGNAKYVIGIEERGEAR